MQNMTRVVVGAAVAAAMLSGGAAAQEAVDWSGFYAGVFAGYGLDRAAATSSTSGPATVEVDPGAFLTIGNDSDMTRFDGLFGGVQAGYNHQVGNVVLGAQGTVEIGDFDKTNSTSFVYSLNNGADFSNNAFLDQTDFSVDWLTTLSGRIGVDLQGWLVYGKAGVALADLSANSSSSYVVESSGAGGPLGPLSNGTYSSSATYSGLRGGAVFGLGAEKMLTPNLSVGAEYSYVHLGDVTVSSAGILGGLLGSGDTQTFSANIHTVKASLNYHF
jgi:outer membrane immunogenic protein